MKTRTQVWYLNLADCLGSTHRYYPDMPDIEFEVEALNDGSHYSHEDYGIPTINLFATAIFAYMLGLSGWEFLKEVKKDEVS